MESSRTAGATSGHNRRAAVKVDAVEMDAVKVDRCHREAAAEADAIGEQQLCTQSCPVLDYSRRRTRGSS